MATSNMPSTRRVELAGFNQRLRFGLAFGIWGFSKGSPVIVDESGWRFQSEIAGEAENFPDK
jgi:hypothetical protein